MPLPIPTRGVHHVVLRVRDVAHAKAFYTQVFGLWPPRRHRDGSASVYCADPDGNVIQILSAPTISPLTLR